MVCHKASEDMPCAETATLKTPTATLAPIATAISTATATTRMTTCNGVSSLVDIIVSNDENIRHTSLTKYCESLTIPQLLEECQKLDDFCRTSENLYEKVRGYFFLYAIHRFRLPSQNNNNNNNNDNNANNNNNEKHDDDNEWLPASGEIPYQGYQKLLERKFASAIDCFLEIHTKRPSLAISSALAKAYYELGFQTLADQVKLSVRQHPGNAWMFTCESVHKHPFRILPDMVCQQQKKQQLPNNKKILQETTPVRMDVSHCGWSDIFFLGMDFPEGAQVLNVSIDLAVVGKHETPVPPIETYLEVIDNEPGVLKLTSIDLECSCTLTKISEVFQFGSDYLGLLKAGIIASGIVPPGLEHSQASIGELWEVILGSSQLGLHLTTKVNDIPKGSRLAVSTNLLGSIISLGMRATQQTRSPLGCLEEEERRLVAARAILGEWLGGSGGGWQDSGGVWPGMKLIRGVPTRVGDPEYGCSRGRLLPNHTLLTSKDIGMSMERVYEKLQDSLVLVHGGMSHNVGPVLEMVTEKYLLRESDEWEARQHTLELLGDMLGCFSSLEIHKLAQLTTRNFMEPLQTIIPCASNCFTETLIQRTSERFGDGFWGFWMLGGCSGGGMGFLFAPDVKPRALIELQQIMLQTKREMEKALPFAMDPVVYEFSINSNGTVANWHTGRAPTLQERTSETIPTSDSSPRQKDSILLRDLLSKLGFDRNAHETIRNEYKNGKIGLKQNRLPLDTKVCNVSPKDVIMASSNCDIGLHRQRGLIEIQRGAVGVVTLAAGIGSRWTQGAGCVKAIHPFCKLGGKHRSFLEIHLAKSRKVSNCMKTSNDSIPPKPLCHVITTSHMTDGPVRTYLHRVQNHGYPDSALYVSHGRSIGLRLVPTVGDLKFAWEETKQQQLDEQAQKVKESTHGALMEWAKSCGEASDYVDDKVPMQCLHPVGHFYEIPNLLLSGTLQKMLQDRPQLKYLMLHNIDTVGADVDPVLLGMFLEGQSTLSFEVIPREIQDVGGGLANVNGHVRLIEGLALPREEDEFKFTYYNSMTTWIHIDKLLSKFGLTRETILDSKLVSTQLQKFSSRLPTYVAIKDVKKRWGNGQEDVMPTAQFEKLWSDMTSLEDMDCTYVLVPRCRGAQLKDQAQLDGWLRDGSSAYLETICAFDD